MSRTMRGLLHNSSGIALTEFALALPILLAVAVTSVELANYVNASMRASQVALSVADNAGRIRDSIDETDVDAIMIGARIAGQGIKFGENGRVFLSMIEVNGLTGTNAGNKITWQRCFGQKNVASLFGTEGAGATNATYAAGFGPAGNKIGARTNAGVMLVEVVYDYEPVFLVESDLIAGLSDSTLRYIAAFPVRERNDNAIKNGFGLPNSQKRLCSRYTST